MMKMKVRQLPWLSFSLESYLPQQPEKVDWLDGQLRIERTIVAKAEMSSTRRAQFSLHVDMVAKVRAANMAIARWKWPDTIGAFPVLSLNHRGRCIDINSWNLLAIFLSFSHKNSLKHKLNCTNCIDCILYSMQFVQFITLKICLCNFIIRS